MMENKIIDAEFTEVGDAPVVEVEKTKREELIATFEKAIEENAIFIGVSVMTKDYVFAEIHIIHISNYAVKLAYFLHVYDEDMMNINGKIQVTGSCYGNTYDDIQDQLSV